MENVNERRYTALLRRWQGVRWTLIAGEEKLEKVRFG